MFRSKNESLIYHKMCAMGQQVYGRIDQRHTEAVIDLKKMARNSGLSFSQVVRQFIKGEI